MTRDNTAFTPEHLRFVDYLRAVGTGPKGNRNLSYEEAKDAFRLILERRVPDPLISAFLLGWRVQGETVQELQGCVDYLAQTLRPQRQRGVEIGYPMDGKAKFFPIMLKAAAQIEAVDVHAAYDRHLSPKYGSSSNEFAPFSQNVRLHDRNVFLPSLSDLTELRNILSLRSAFNTIEKLNFLAPVALIGMHHAPYFDLYSQLYANHYDRLFIVQGHEGTPEILKKTKYRIVEGQESTVHTIDPEEFGIEPILAKEELSLAQMRSLMESPDANLSKMIRLNAAFIGYASGLYTTPEEGYRCLQD